MRDWEVFLKSQKNSSLDGCLKIVFFVFAIPVGKLIQINLIWEIRSHNSSSESTQSDLIIKKNKIIVWLTHLSFLVSSPSRHHFCIQRRKQREMTKRSLIRNGRVLLQARSHEPELNHIAISRCKESWTLRVVFFCFVFVFICIFNFTSMMGGGKGEVLISILLWLSEDILLTTQHLDALQNMLPSVPLTSSCVFFCMGSRCCISCSSDLYTYI